MSTDAPTSGAVALGNCESCSKVVWGGEVTIDAEGKLWHPACRTKGNKRAARA